VAPNEQTRRERAEDLLDRLDLGSDAVGALRREVLVVLSDDKLRHPRRHLAEAGHPISAGATTRELFDAAARNLGRTKRIDRELRDYVFPQLIGVGLVDKLHINSRDEIAKTGQFFVVGEHPIAKSPNSGYVLTDPARQLLVKIDNTAWPSLRNEWLKSSRARRQQSMRRRASEAVATARPASKHSVLIGLCVDALRNSVAAGFELVFVDDADGDRIQERWQSRLEALGLMPDLASRWPDAMLVNLEDQTIWFIDAVTSDGEIDEPRARDLRLWAKKRGYTVAGMTTAYENWKRAGSRQASQGNLAIGGTVWIAEDGGKLLEISSLA
jgi:BsuBI/PstI restriction endonuclease domain